MSEQTHAAMNKAIELVDLPESLERPTEPSLTPGLPVLAHSPSETHASSVEETNRLRIRLEELSSDLEPEVVRSLVSDFVVDLPTRFDALQELVLNVQTKEAELAAHSLKGVSQTFGLSEIGRLFESLENASEAAQPELMRQHLQALQRQLAPTIARLKDWLEAEARGDHAR